VSEERSEDLHGLAASIENEQALVASFDIYSMDNPVERMGNLLLAGAKIEKDCIGR